MGTVVGMRRFQVVLVFMFSLAFVIIPTMSATGAALDSPDLLFRSSRHISPFVRRNLEAWLNNSSGGQSGLAASSRSYHHAVFSPGNRARRLAGTANCSSSPNMCNSTAFPAGSTCCASTGTCVNLSTDKSNCGICSYSCAASLGCCGGTCASILTDNLNCGSCGTMCKNSLCAAGMCGYGG